MKLFYSPGVCSLSPHIVLCEAALAYELERVDLTTKKTDKEANFFDSNPKGYVPALLLEDGQMLTEGPAIVQYLADLVPEKKLAPPNGTMERYRLQEWLNFIATELHKGYSPLFKASAPDDWKTIVRDLLLKRLAVVAESLGDRDYLMGEQFTVADAYLFTVLRWSKGAKIDLTPWPVLVSYQERVGARPAVIAAIAAEKQNASASPLLKKGCC